MSEENMLALLKKSNISLDKADIVKIDREKKEIEVISEDGQQRHVKTFKMYRDTYELKDEVTRTLDVKKDYWQDIIDLYNDGYTQTQIAKRLGISQSYVAKLLKKYK